MKKGLDINALMTGLLITFGAAYVFYNNLFGLIPSCLAGVYSYITVSKNNKEKKRIKRLSELKSMMVSFQSSLAAGKSMESAVHMATEDLIKIYGEKNVIVDALRQGERKIELKISLEKALIEFAKDVDLREAEDFAIVIATIKRTGGNAVRIIKDTVERIVSEIELREEIATVVAAKRLELMIMVYMPALISLFLRVTNKGFLDPLFGTVPGFIIMTILMLANLGADYLGRKIVTVM